MEFFLLNRFFLQPRCTNSNKTKHVQDGFVFVGLQPIYRSVGIPLQLVGKPLKIHCFIVNGLTINMT